MSLASSVSLSEISLGSISPGPFRTPSNFSSYRTYSSASRPISDNLRYYAMRGMEDRRTSGVMRLLKENSKSSLKSMKMLHKENSKSSLNSLKMQKENSKSSLKSKSSVKTRRSVPKVKQPLAPMIKVTSSPRAGSGCSGVMSSIKSLSPIHVPRVEVHLWVQCVSVDAAPILTGKQMTNYVLSNYGCTTNVLYDINSLAPGRFENFFLVKSLSS